MLFKQTILDTLAQIPDYEFNKLRYHLDLRTWYRVSINGEMMEWWACDDEITDLKARHTKDVLEFTEIPLIETIICN